jgi:signal transduction histidine kinase
VAAIVLGFSLFLYQSLQRNFRDAGEDDFADTQSQQHFVGQTLSSLQKEILLADLIILCAAAGLSYALAGWTLKPAQRSSEAQQAFAANASHELRTPLAIMKNDVEVLMRNKAPSQELIRSTLKSNLEEIQHMSHIVESLLSLARSGNQTKLTLTRLDLKELVTTVAAKITVLATQSGIKLTVSAVGSSLIQGNASSLERAILNVVRNSLDHTSEGGSITINLKDENKQAILRIVDTGAGINPDDLPHVFERFYKGNGSESESGAGLGLTIVKEVVERHGGTISIESTSGKGTTVSIRLPLS